MLKLLLAVAIPFQPMVDSVSPTHGFINRQALAILTADGKRREAAWLEWYLDDFTKGCDWADGGWRNVGHMYDPQTGAGLLGWPSAPELIRHYWDAAIRAKLEYDLPHAFFFLGAAAHLVQDLCVPHHAAVQLFAGHKKFEAYARRYRHRFAAHERGLYDLARTPEGWVVMNAGYTRQHYSHCVTSDGDVDARTEAIYDLLPRAQRSTAGFVAHFLGAVGLGALNTSGGVS